MDRYVKVPVTCFHDIYGTHSWLAWLDCGCENDTERDLMRVVGCGATEEEAFANLLAKLGYEEVR